jgi:hypothetical protein
MDGLLPLSSQDPCCLKRLVAFGSSHQLSAVSYQKFILIADG